MLGRVRDECVVAAAQTVPVAGDVAANVEAHLALARTAAAEGARALLFPELSLTGYEIGRARDLAFAEDDARLAPLVDAADRHRMTLVAGAPVRIGERLHIGAFAIGPDRRVQLYTKRRLGAFPPEAAVDGTVPPAESTVFEPGDRDPVLAVGGRPAAIAICADVGAPEHPRAAAARGARVYLAGMFAIPSESAGEEARLASIAARHGMAVVFANFGGPSGGLRSAGGSAILSERGEAVARLGPAGAGVVVAESVEGRWRGRAFPVPTPLPREGGPG
jgi:predicted amidohydrolase